MTEWDEFKRFDWNKSLRMKKKQYPLFLMLEILLINLLLKKYTQLVKIKSKKKVLDIKFFLYLCSR